MRHQVVRFAELAPALGEDLGLVVPAEPAEGAAEHRGVGRQLAESTDRLECLAGFAEVACGRVVVTCDESDRSEPLPTCTRPQFAHPLIRGEGHGPCLVDSVKHGQQQPSQQKAAGIGVFGKDGVERHERLACGPRSNRQGHGQHRGEPGGYRMTRTACVLNRALHRPCPIFESVAHVGDPGQRMPHAREAVLVAGCFEQRQRLLSAALQLFGRSPAAVESSQSGDHARECHARFVFSRDSALGRTFCDRYGTHNVDPVEGVNQLDLQAEVEPERPCRQQRALEQSGCRPPVAPPVGTVPCDAQPHTRSKRHVGIRPAELVEVASRLLEVVAEDLVQLDEALAVLCEPVGEAMVQVCPRRFG